MCFPEASARTTCKSTVILHSSYKQRATGEVRTTVLLFPSRWHLESVQLARSRTSVRTLRQRLLPGEKCHRKRRNSCETLFSFHQSQVNGLLWAIGLRLCLYPRLIQWLSSQALNYETVLASTTYCDRLYHWISEFGIPFSVIECTSYSSLNPTFIGETLLIVGR